MDFEKYQHLEKLGHAAVQGIEHGQCYIFPKIDGTNAQIWFDGEGLAAGSRTRRLSIESDNAGFFAWAKGDERANGLVRCHPKIRFFGEWLVKHTLKTYREEAWRRFYVFDAYCHEKERWLPFDEYSEFVQEWDLDLVEPMCIINNPIEANIVHELTNNTFLIQDGQGHGEGVVVKNYSFTNKFGDVNWAKLVRTEFKERHGKEMGICEKTGSIFNESILAEEFVTPELVAKERAKIELEILNDANLSGRCHPDNEPDPQGADIEEWEIMMEGALAKARGQIIPRLLEHVFHCVVTEEIWAMLKKLKGGDQTIDFKKLRAQVIIHTKKYAADLF